MNEHLNRRSFIKRLSQGAIVLSATSLVFLLNKREQIKPTNECSRSNNICKKCSKLQNCELPQAKSEKANKKGWVL